MADDTWDTRERLWLEQIDAANRAGQGWMPDEFTSNDEAVWRAAVFDWDALKDGGYISVKVDQRNGVGKPAQIWGTRLTARGRRRSAAGPTTPPEPSTNYSAGSTT